MAQTRREFLVSAAVGAAALSVAASPLLARVGRGRRGANDEIRVAVLGLNGRGRDHIGGFMSVPGVRIVALCDVDSAVLAREVKALADKGVKVDGVADMRRIMDRKDIDAVSIATPNHWHSLAAIWACQSGKDVYVEKPVSHNIWEGRQLVRAARKHTRIVQAGMQARSSPAIAEAIAWVRDGNMGRIRVARGLCYKPRKSIGKVESEQRVPEGIDYDLWTGPAAMRPLMRKRLHYDWHWDFNTGNGDLGNQGIHQVDICRWALGEKGLAPSVTSIGGRFGYDDDGETPNTHLVWLGYKSAPLVFEVRGLPRDSAAQASKWDQMMDSYKGQSIGVVIECEGGYLVVSSDYSRASAHDETGAEVKKWKENRDHYANFVDAVRSRKQSDLAAEIEEGHISSVLCHMGNIAHRVGTAMSREAIAGRLSDNAPLREAFDRFGAHLDANGVDLAKTPAHVGPVLSFDPASERFTDHDGANALLRRDARSPFVVPEEA